MLGFLCAVNMLTFDFGFLFLPTGLPDTEARKLDGGTRRGLDRPVRLRQRQPLDGLRRLHQLEDQDQVRALEKPRRRGSRLHRGRRRRQRLRQRRAVVAQVHPEDPDPAGAENEAAHRAQLGRRFG